MTSNVLRMVRIERDRQDTLIAEGVIPHDLALAYVPSGLKLGVLTEELGEVAKALNDQEGSERLREELVQVAACAVAWAESLT